MSQRARPGVGSAQFLLPPVSVPQTIAWFDPHAEFILGPCNLRLGLSCKLWSPVWEEIIIQPTAEDTGIRSSRQYLRSSSHGIVTIAPMTGLCRLGIYFQTLLHKKHLSKSNNCINTFSWSAKCTSRTIRVFILLNIRKFPLFFSFATWLRAAPLVCSLTNEMSGGVLRKELWPGAEEMDADRLGWWINHHVSWLPSTHWAAL